MIFQKQINDMYRKTMCVRNDNADGIFYFGPSDFPGLQAHPHAFRATAGHDLQGYFYHYADPIPGKLVVFEHGMGNGHRAYMREIETLCKAGFLVFSYDHTGCMESGGENTNGFAQSLADLNDCIGMLKELTEIADRSLSVVGHSWGGFSTMNIGALHPEITHLVVLSGFISVEKIVNQSFSGPLKFFRRGILELERQMNPVFAEADGVRSLRDTRAKVLLIHSEDDPMVSMKFHFEELRTLLGGMKNIRFLAQKGKFHNPTYTDEAVVYKDKFFADFQKARSGLKTPEQKKAFMEGFNFRKMTEQDQAVWKEITDHLNS
jgi:pimeloyl-ACP methyl ester carboxylesterase